jgi:hypothetical protein
MGGERLSRLLSGMDGNNKSGNKEATAKQSYNAEAMQQWKICGAHENETERIESKKMNDNETQ